MVRATRNVRWATGTQWKCICGRTLTKLKCMKCGDRLPHWIREGKITPELRHRMDTRTYKQWHEQSLTDRDVANALKDISTWVRPKKSQR